MPGSSDLLIRMRKATAVAVLAAFFVNTVAVPGYGAGDYLRPAAAKQSNSRLQSLGQELGAGKSPLSKDGGIADISREVPVVEAKNNPSATAKRLTTLLHAYRNRIIELLAQKPQDLSDQLEKIVNEINAKEPLKKLPHIGVASIAYVEDYQQKQLAKKYLLEGKLMLQMPFAGAGSRMDNSLTAFGIKLPAEEIRLTNIDIWNIAQKMGRIVYEKAIKAGKTDTEAQEAVRREGLILEIPSYAQHIGFAEREMLALEQSILNLERDYGFSKAEVAKVKDNLKLVISVSDEIFENTNRMFSEPSRLSGEPFFGFNPKNVVFVMGGYGPGFEYDAQGALKANNAKASWNHGYAFIELAWLKGPQAYILTRKDRDGKASPEYLGDSVFQYALDRGATTGCIHRINDLILMHPRTAIDVDMFNAYLNLRTLPGNEDINMYLEMMANPTNQKGGLALTEDGKHLILFEGLATKDERIDEKISQLANKEMKNTKGQRGIPYNRLYGYYDIEALVTALAVDKMPLLIKQKAGVFSPEIPTGDATWLDGIKAMAGVRRTDWLIKDGILPNEQRDPDNNTLYEKDGRTPKKAWFEANGGSGSMIHDCKEAKYIKDGLLVVEAMDNPSWNFYAKRYYVNGGISVSMTDETFNGLYPAAGNRFTVDEVLKAINVPHMSGYHKTLESLFFRFNGSQRVYNHIKMLGSKLDSILPFMKQLGDEKTADKATKMTAKDHTLDEAFHAFDFLVRGDIEGYNDYRVKHYGLTRAQGLPTSGPAYDSFITLRDSVLQDPYDRALMFMLPLIHDIGKTVNDKGHPEIGARYFVKPVLERLGFVTLEKYYQELGAYIVEKHVDLATVNTTERTPEYLMKGLERFSPAIQKKALAMLTILSMADRSFGSRADKFTAKDFAEYLAWGDLDSPTWETYRRARAQDPYVWLTKRLSYSAKGLQALPLINALAPADRAALQKYIGSQIEVFDYGMYVFDAFMDCDPTGRQLVKFLTVLSKISQAKDDFAWNHITRINLDKGPIWIYAVYKAIEEINAADDASLIEQQLARKGIMFQTRGGAFLDVKIKNDAMDTMYSSRALAQASLPKVLAGGSLTKYERSALESAFASDQAKEIGITEKTQWPTEVSQVAGAQLKFSRNKEELFFSGVSVVSHHPQKEYPLFGRLIDIINSNSTGYGRIATVDKGSEHITLYDLVCQGNDWEAKLGILRQNAFSGNQDLKALLQKDVDDSMSLKIWKALEWGKAIDGYGKPSEGINNATHLRLKFLYEELGGKKEDCDKFEQLIAAVLKSVISSQQIFPEVQDQIMARAKILERYEMGRMEALEQATYRVITEKTALALSVFSIGQIMSIPKFRPHQIGTFIPSRPTALVLNMKPASMEDLVKMYALQDAVYQQTGIRNFVTFKPHITLGYIIRPVGDTQYFRNILGRLQQEVARAVLAQDSKDIFDVSQIRLAYFAGMNNFARVAEFAWQKQQPFKKDAVRTALRRQQKKERVRLDGGDTKAELLARVNNMGSNLASLDRFSGNGTVIERSALIQDQANAMQERLNALQDLKQITTRSAILKGYTDLHMHTFYSDGFNSPARVVYDAWKQGADTIAITDHNTLEGVEEALRAARILGGIRVIPGIEFNFSEPHMGIVFGDVLAYWPAVRDLSQYADLLGKLEENGLLSDTNKRIYWNLKKQWKVIANINKKFKAYGIEINPQDVIGRLGYYPSIWQVGELLNSKYGLEQLNSALQRIRLRDEALYTQMIAKLVENAEGRRMLKSATDVGKSFIRGLKDVYIGEEDLVGPEYANGPFSIPLQSIVSRGHASGASIVLPHPFEDRYKGSADVETNVLRLFDQYALDGIEESGKIKRDADKKANEALIDKVKASRQDLIVTSGTDYHADPNETDLRIGYGTTIADLQPSLSPFDGGRGIAPTREENIVNEIASLIVKLADERFNEQLEGAYRQEYDRASQVGNGKLAAMGFEKNPKKGMLNRVGWTIPNIEAVLNGSNGSLSYKDIIRKADEIRSKYKFVIFCGMGGSGLSVEFVKQTFGENEINGKKVKFYSLRTTDPGAIQTILDDIRNASGHDLEAGLAQTLAIPISKSATTPETVAHKKYFEKLFMEKNMDPADHMWLVTDETSPWGKEEKQYPRLDIQLNKAEDIGGRFTAPSTLIFLLPMALTAPDLIEPILGRAIEMNRNAVQEDFFLKLGAALYARAYYRGQDKLTMIVPKELKALPMWSEQLFEESLGKSGKGVTVFYGEELSAGDIKEPGRNDRVFLRISMKGAAVDADQEMLWEFLNKKGYPVFEYSIDGREDVGAVMLGLQRTVAAIGYLWDICFVDQPAVQLYKDKSKVVQNELEPTEEQKRSGAIPKTKQEKLSEITIQSITTDGITLNYSPLIQAGIITPDELKQEIKTLTGKDSTDKAAVTYAAILNILIMENAFGPRVVQAVELTSYGAMTDAVRASFQRARTEIFTKKLRLPSKLGEGPDKNHSYQQNIEEGGNIFFSTYFMSVNNPQVEVPFSDTMLFAQALGTVQSVADRGRKVILIVTEDRITENQVDAFFNEVNAYIAVTPQPAEEPADTVQYINNTDRDVYRELSFYFGNVINSVALEKTEGALVIGANTIFENAGSLAALKQAHNAVNTLDIAVWAKTDTDAAALKALGVDKAATIYTGLGEALMAMEKLKISPKKIVLINSDLDLANIRDEYPTYPDASAFFDANPELRSVHVATAKTGGTIKQINAVPLALAKAIAIIFDVGNTRAQFAKMVQAFKDKGMISEADARSLNELAIQLSDIPLVTVGDDIAKLQVMYEDTLNKV